MRTISLLICIFGFALGACAEKTPPPRTAAPAPAERRAGMTPDEGAPADSTTPAARPEPRKADPAASGDDMSAPRPTDGAAESDTP
jgi:hypothetical protein